VTKPRDFIDQINIAQTLLGLDFGDKTIGVAVSDKSKTIASPIITIKRKGVLKDIEELLSILKEYDVGGIILGLPLSLDGSENERTEKVRKFAQELKKCKDIKIAFQDERYSSDVIYKELRKNSISKDKIKKKIDQMAASYILQGFLDNAKHTRI
jgi:putative Holliday junction resolvase